MSKPLQCDIQDHFEHVCVLRLPVRLILKNDQAVSGTAVDLVRLDGQEALKLAADAPCDPIVLTDIKTLSYPEPGLTDLNNLTRWQVIQLAES